MAMEDYGSHGSHDDRRATAAMASAESFMAMKSKRHWTKADKAFVASRRFQQRAAQLMEMTLEKFWEVEDL